MPLWEVTNCPFLKFCFLSCKMRIIFVFQAMIDASLVSTYSNAAGLQQTTPIKTDIRCLPWWEHCSLKTMATVVAHISTVPGNEYKWSQETKALPTSVSSLPVHGEKGKVVGRSNFPLQLENWWAPLFLPAPTVSPCSGRSVGLMHRFKIELRHLVRRQKC